MSTENINLKIPKYQGSKKRLTVKLKIKENKIFYEFGSKEYELPLEFKNYNKIKEYFRTNEKIEDEDLEIIKSDIRMLIRKQYSLNYILGSVKKYEIKDGKAKLNVAKPKVYFFYDRQEYTDKSTGLSRKISPEEWLSNLYKSSMQGGREVIDGFGKVLEGKPIAPNPLHVRECPDHNIFGAANCSLVGHGGYFGNESTHYRDLENPIVKTATVIVANGYEFEGFSAQDFCKKECPFISINTNEKFAHLVTHAVLRKNSNNFWEIANRDDAQQVKSEIKELYLDKEAFQVYVRDKVIQQFLAILQIHQQEGKTGGIQVNTSLAGLGFFANLGANSNCSITPDIAETVAQAYKDAIEHMSRLTRDDSVPYIKSVRFTYPPRDNSNKMVKSMDAERNAIDKVFEFPNNTEESSNKKSSIEIKKSRCPVEFIEEGIETAIIVAGDPRATPGNEQRGGSQEPGVFQWILNGRQIFDPAINGKIFNNIFQQKTIDITEIQELQKQAKVQKAQQKTKNRRTKSIIAIVTSVIVGVAAGVALGVMTGGIGPLVIGIGVAGCVLGGASVGGGSALADIFFPSKKPDTLYGWTKYRPHHKQKKQNKNPEKIITIPKTKEIEDPNPNKTNDQNPNPTIRPTPSSSM